MLRGVNAKPEHCLPKTPNVNAVWVLALVGLCAFFDVDQCADSDPVVGIMSRALIVC
jgi:hypothetical protein